eukprot:jgi/Chrzof1/10474/UNPLg00402.t1
MYSSTNSASTATVHQLPHQQPGVSSIPPQQQVDTPSNQQYHQQHQQQSQLHVELSRPLIADDTRRRHRWLLAQADAEVATSQTLEGNVPGINKALVPSAMAALAAAKATASTHHGISDGVPGLSLEDKILLARLLGHEVKGSFDELGSASPTDRQYWRALEHQMEHSIAVKQMFESTWYKCSKLAGDWKVLHNSTHAMEEAAHAFTLEWLNINEEQLPRPGVAVPFPALIKLLDAIKAKARVVTDPIPYLKTQVVPIDRNGFPMLVHMTFKDKSFFYRHHLISIASWAKLNPDYNILMYDDHDLHQYLTYDDTVLQLHQALKTPVERSDLWRYMVMCRHGGIYADTDTLCVRPVQEWNSEHSHDADVLIGVEDVFRRNPSGPPSSWGVVTGRFGIQFAQWTLAGAPGSKVYCAMADMIRHRQSAESRRKEGPKSSDAPNWKILHRTGPHVWTDSVLSYMKYHQTGFHEALQPDGKLVGNVRVMPAETFGCAAHFFSNVTRLEDIYVMHMFRGAWRKAHKRFHALSTQKKRKRGNQLL